MIFLQINLSDDQLKRYRQNWMTFIFHKKVQNVFVGINGLSCS